MNNDTSTQTRNKRTPVAKPIRQNVTNVFWFLAWWPCALLLFFCYFCLLYKKSRAQVTGVRDSFLHFLSVDMVAIARRGFPVWRNTRVPSTQLDRQHSCETVVYKTYVPEKTLRPHIVDNSLKTWRLSHIHYQKRLSQGNSLTFQSFFDKSSTASTSCQDKGSPKPKLVGTPISLVTNTSKWNLSLLFYSPDLSLQTQYCTCWTCMICFTRRCRQCKWSSCFLWLSISLDEITTPGLCKSHMAKHALSCINALHLIRTNP